MKLPDLSGAAACLAAGGLLLYPTETFYALGCRADAARALDAIYRIKRRPPARPLGLVAANAAQVALVALPDGAPAGLTDLFWPGPLTLLLPARPGLDARVAPQGQVAVRVPGHALARRLARLAAYPLTASSANLSGRSPAATLAALDDALVQALEGCGLPWGIVPAPAGFEPAGGLPSSLVQPMEEAPGSWRLRILREGAISTRRLQEAGFGTERG